jgi:hypothetical protein
MNKLAAKDTEFSKLRQLHKRARRTVRFIGKLTALDGAVLISQDFTVFGFSAKLRSSLDETFDIYCEDLVRDTSTSVRLSDFQGMRHQSAARYVYQHKESIAFVASQDGVLSLLFWDEKNGKLTVLKHLEFFGSHL